MTVAFTEDNVDKTVVDTDGEEVGEASVIESTRRQIILKEEQLLSRVILKFGSRWRHFGPWCLFGFYQYKVRDHVFRGTV